MQLKHSVMIGFMGRQADRFHEYQPAHTLAERLAMAARVQGVDGIEPVYPNDFVDGQASIDLIRDSGLADLGGQPQRQVRATVATRLVHRARSGHPRRRRQLHEDAMDLAAELGTEMITCCPLIDGHNYSFQADYLKQWGWLEEGIAEAAAHRDDIKISLEYKLNESRNYWSWAIWAARSTSASASACPTLA